MIWKGRDLDYRSLWEALGVSIPEHDNGSFSSLLPCPNPEHDNKRSPAFQCNLVNPLCHCFAHCGISGTIEHAVKVIQGCNEKEARQFIAGFTRAALGVEVETFGGNGLRKTLDGDSAAAKDQQRLEQGEFTYLPQRARDYLDRRGIDNTSRGQWQIGFDEEAERLVIPTFDQRGNFRFLIRRAIDGRQPKYLYTVGAAKSSLLFGLLQIPTSERILVLVEGSLDAIRRQQGGMPAVATLGSGLSEQQVKIIDRQDPEKVFCMFDRDGAGVDNVIDAQKKLSRFSVFVCRYRGVGSDPAEVGDNEAWRMVERAIPVHDFLRTTSKLTTTRATKTKERV